MIRGIEGRSIVDDDQDRRDFVRRLVEVAEATGTTVFAWALMSNHAHILLARGAIGGIGKIHAPASHRLRRRLQSSHRRHGHLFQNRYKSIVCDGDSYFTEVVRYIHVNPLRVKLVDGRATPIIGAPATRTDNLKRQELLELLRAG